MATISINGTQYTSTLLDIDQARYLHDLMMSVTETVGDQFAAGTEFFTDEAIENMFPHMADGDRQAVTPSEMVGAASKAITEAREDWEQSNEAAGRSAG